ncbi:GAF domain-containing protein [Luteibacter jiangsuensis]
MSELPDLTRCDREPIHIPGSIQPHGVLLVVDAATKAILQASENVGEVTGVDVETALDAPLHEIVELPQGLFDETRPAHSAWVPVTLPHASAGGPWYAVVHAYDTRWLVEIERRDIRFDDDPRQVARELARSMENDLGVDRAGARVVRTIRSLLGYDRVMVYRFDRDWHGEIIAEARRDSLEAYLGLHYPSTDIPAQARALYLRNRVRQISDCKYVPARILPAYDPVTAEATDLSDVSLRSVSPVHLEYLGNMGVTGTLVASIIVGGTLWGLISCHHYSPFFADHRMREAADAIATAFAARVAAIEELGEIELESALLTVREKLITAFDESDRIDPALLGRVAPELLEMVDADGIAIAADGHMVRHGELPGDTVLLRILDKAKNAPVTFADVVHTDDIGAWHADLAVPVITQMAAGIVYLPLPIGHDAAILWTRTEQVRQVRWGGNPSLAKLETIPGARLSPRQSFDTWQETVRGRSRPWSRQHLESALALRAMIRGSTDASSD